MILWILFFLILYVTSLLWLAFHGFCVRSCNQNFAGLCWMADDSMMWTAVSCGFLLIQMVHIRSSSLNGTRTPGTHWHSFKLCVYKVKRYKQINPANSMSNWHKKKRTSFIVMHIFQPEGVGVVIIYQVLKISLTLKFLSDAVSIYLILISGSLHTLRILVKDWIFISREDIKNFSDVQRNVQTLFKSRPGRNRCHFFTKSDVWNDQKSARWPLLPIDFHRFSMTFRHGYLPLL